MFNPNIFFAELIEWFSFLADGTFNSVGKEVQKPSPLPSGRILPPSFSKVRRFYKHGCGEHVSIVPSEEAKLLLKPVAQSFESSPVALTPSFTEDISYLREIISSAKMMASLLDDDPD